MSLFGKQTEPAVFKKAHDLSYTFIIQRVADGPFKNLWKLEARTPKDEGFIEIVDADMLSTVLGKIGYIFEQDGL